MTSEAAAWSQSVGATTALVDGASLAYLTVRRQETDEGVRWELGTIGHGPDAEALTARLCAEIRVWSSERGRRPTVTAYPAGTPHGEPTGIAIAKTHSTLVLTYDGPEPADESRSQ